MCVLTISKYIQCNKKSYTYCNKYKYYITNTKTHPKNKKGRHNILLYKTVCKPCLAQLITYNILQDDWCSDFFCTMPILYSNIDTFPDNCKAVNKI